MATFEINLDINRPVGEVFAFISRNTKFSILLFRVTGLISPGCGAGQLVRPTSTPLPGTTPSPTPTLVPTQTSTPFPASSAYNPVPRWMILGQPGKEPYLFFEQCFAMT